MDNYLGEIRAFGFNFAPQGWAFCNGALLNISTNTALFALLGTTYGGNGQNTFGLPNLQGRFALGFNAQTNQPPIGQISGSQTVTLTQTQMPAHVHTLPAGGSLSVKVSANPATASVPASGTATLAAGIFADPNSGNSPSYMYNNDTAPGITLNGVTGSGGAGANTGPAGGSQPVSIMPPSQAVNYCIAIQGMFPTRN